MDTSLIQYYFTCEEHPIVKSSHGNSKGKSPYKRTMPSTLGHMKDLCKTTAPVEILEAIDDEVGDIIGQSSSSSHLHNLTQVYSAQRKLKLEGNPVTSKSNVAQLADTMEMCESGHDAGNEKFVRCVQAAPEPMCILASDRQLDEMVRNFTDESQFFCLGVDPTFKLGAFYVAPIVFALRMLVTRQHGKSPIYLGPMLIHQTQQFSAYHYFASQLPGLRKELVNVRAIGTDGEVALYEAFSHVFTKAVYLHCFSHFKRNIEEKLRNLHFPDAVIKEITKDIFGFVTSEEKQLGLVDSPNEEVFREQLEMLKFRWNELEVQNCLSPNGVELQPVFHKWFTDEKSNIVVSCMLKNIRVTAGMGKDPEHFYTNMSESLNKTLKERTDYKAQDLRLFVNKMLKFHHAQESLLKKAIIKCDRWRFREEYNHLEIDSDKWFTMNEKQHVKRVLSEPLTAIVICECDSPVLPHLPPLQEKNESMNMQLSVTYQSLFNSHRIANETLKDIWQKAYHLVTNSGLICKVPGQPDSDNRMVASLPCSGNPPHYVEKKSKGQFICSVGTCHRFTAYKICEHIVVACEDSGNLSIFCNWCKSKKCGPNLDALALSGFPKRVAGNKGGVPTCSRHGRKSLKTSKTLTTCNHISTVTAHSAAADDAVSPTPDQAYSCINIQKGNLHQMVPLQVIWLEVISHHLFFNHMEFNHIV